MVFIQGGLEEEILGKILQVPFVKTSVEAAGQDPCVRLFVLGVLRRCPQKIFVRDLRVRFLFELSIDDLRATPLLPSPGLRTRSLKEVSLQDLCTRLLQELSWQDLCKRPLGKISEQISIRGLLARPLDTISLRDLLARFLFEISVQDV